MAVLTTSGKRITGCAGRAWLATANPQTPLSLVTLSCCSNIWKISTRLCVRFGSELVDGRLRHEASGRWLPSRLASTIDPLTGLRSTDN